MTAADGTARPDLMLFGDSITFAWPNPDPERRRHYGMPGETAVQLRARFAAAALASGPRVIQIMAGTNDVAENGGPYDPAATLSAIAEMAAAARGRGAAVLLASVPPAGRLYWNPAVDAVGRIGALNEALARLADADGHRFVDYGRVLDDGTGAMRRGFADDGVHPTPAGYAAMETVLEPMAAALLGR